MSKRLKLASEAGRIEGTWKSVHNQVDNIQQSAVLRVDMERFNTDSSRGRLTVLGSLKGLLKTIAKSKVDTPPGLVPSRYTPTGTDTGTDTGTGTGTGAGNTPEESMVMTVSNSATNSTSSTSSTNSVTGVNASRVMDTDISSLFMKLFGWWRVSYVATASDMQQCSNIRIGLELVRLLDVLLIHTIHIYIQYNILIFLYIYINITYALF